MAGLLVLLGSLVPNPAYGEDKLPSPFPWFVGYDWGPVASELEDSDGNERFRAAGPFWESSSAPDGKKLWATPRPVFACAVDPQANRTSWDSLWPVASGKRFYDQVNWRVLNGFFFNRDCTDALSQYHFWFLPLWFHGRDENGVGLQGPVPRRRRNPKYPLERPHPVCSLADLDAEPGQ